MSTQTTIQITQDDFDKLTRLIQELTPASGKTPEHLASLTEELKRAEVKAGAEIDADVITLNSRAELLELATDDLMEFSLVFPEDADIDAGRISVLAPLGTAMLGYRVGDVFEWKTPRGTNKARIQKILFQPEVGYRAENKE